MALAVEDAVVALRDAHPAWVGRKLHHAPNALWQIDFMGQPVAVRPTGRGGVFAVWYCQRRVAAIDLTEPS